jgi:hypothetical protein
MNNKPYNKNKMKTRKAQKFDIERVKEFCKLVNEGKTPAEALRLMNSCNGYTKPLRAAGIFWQEKDSTFRAVERIHAERYTLFLNERLKYNRTINAKPNRKQRKTFQKVDVISKRNSYKEYTKQANLFAQPKPKQPIAQKVKPNEPKLNFIQRVVKSLFNL